MSALLFSYLLFSIYNTLQYYWWQRIRFCLAISTTSILISFRSDFCEWLWDSSIVPYLVMNKKNVAYSLACSSIVTGVSTATLYGGYWLRSNLSLMHQRTPADELSTTLGPRSSKAFVAIDCAGSPASKVTAVKSLAKDNISDIIAEPSCCQSPLDFKVFGIFEYLLPQEERISFQPHFASGWIQKIKFVSDQTALMASMSFFFLKASIKSPR